MADMYEFVTNQVIEALETAIANDWTCPWQKIGIGNFTNYDTNKAYNGVNIILLAIAKSKKGFASNYWIGQSQAIKKGLRIQRSEFGKRTMITMPIMTPKLDENGKEVKDANGKTILEFKGYKGTFVYNCSQLENWVEPSKVELSKKERISAIEAFLQKPMVTINEGGDSAYYSPSNDSISIPSLNQFNNSELYYAVLSHEMIHATAHKDRCNRDLSKYSFDNSVRAFEEIIAELGSAFICSEFGIFNETRKDHLPYIKGWVSILRENKKAIMQAASQASKAVNWIKAA